MALCGDAALVLYYDFAGGHADHDHWHSHEHMHERLRIPGFARGTRWVALGGGPRYLIVYELADEATASSAAYLARLNDPTPWTRAVMGRFRDVTRGVCAVTASAGVGLGRFALSVRFVPAAGREAALRDRIAGELMPRLAGAAGIAGIHLLQPAPPPPMTREQSLRGQDSAVGWILLATAYDLAALERAGEDTLAPAALARHGCAPGVQAGVYALDFTMSAQDAQRTLPVSPPSR